MQVQMKTVAACTEPKPPMVHAFEIAGLGRAPFKCVGMWEMPPKSLLEHNVDAWNNAISNAPRTSAGGPGSCHYCGTGILNHFLIKSADGKTFLVGSDCVRKTGDAGLINAVKRKAARVKEAKRTAEQNTRMAATQEAERQKNGGLTDYELYREHQENTKRARFHKYAADNEWLIRIIRLVPGGFTLSMIEQLSFDSITRLSGKQLATLQDIYCRTFGRRNSKHYDAAEKEFWDKFDAVVIAEGKTNGNQ